MKLSSVIGHGHIKSSGLLISIVVLLISSFLLLSCKKEEVPVAPVVEDVTITSGTSFGHCIGYCLTEVQITNTVATFTKSSWVYNPAYPEVKRAQLLTTAEWKSLLHALDPAALTKVDSRSEERRVGKECRL